MIMATRKCGIQNRVRKMSKTANAIFENGANRAEFYCKNDPFCDRAADRCGCRAAFVVVFCGCFPANTGFLAVFMLPCRSAVLGISVAANGAELAQKRAENAAKAGVYPLSFGVYGGRDLQHFAGCDPQSFVYFCGLFTVCRCADCGKQADSLARKRPRMLAVRLGVFALPVFGLGRLYSRSDLFCRRLLGIGLPEASHHA